MPRRLERFVEDQTAEAVDNSGIINPPLPSPAGQVPRIKIPMNRNRTLSLLALMVLLWAATPHHSMGYPGGILGQIEDQLRVGQIGESTALRW